MRVYVAGPYSSGDVDENVRTAIRCADAVLESGHTPFLPHLTHFWDQQKPHTYETWLQYDSEWLAVCDALIRIPGESPGADREVAQARNLGIHVFYGIDEWLSAVCADRNQSP